MTGLGAYQMVLVVALGGVTMLEAVMTGVFVMTFGWIAFAAASALAGLLAPPPRHSPIDAASRPSPPAPRWSCRSFTRTRCGRCAALAGMAKGLAARCQACAFEIVVLSDSTDADAWVAETAAVDRLRRRSRA